MIKKNILAIALLSVLGLSHAADVENLRTISYLNEPLRLQADIIGEGEIKLANPTEYLRLNHPIPRYDLSINVLEINGQRQLVLVTTEEVESPALTLLLESNDANNRKQLFELPILLDFKPEITIEEESAISENTVTDIAPEEMVDKSEVNAASVAKAEAKIEEQAEVELGIVELADVPAAIEKTPEIIKQNTAALPEVVKAESRIQAEAKTIKVAPKKAEAVATKVVTKNNDLIKRYGPVAKGETLWSIANKVRTSDVTPQKMIEIIKKNNPSAFTSNGVLRADVTLIIPSKTQAVQHKFVKAEDAKNSRVGFIYELPTPPVKVEAPVLEAQENVEVQVVQPISGNAPITTDPIIAPDSESAITEPQESDTLVPESVENENIQPQIEVGNEVISPVNQSNTDVATPKLEEVETLATVQDLQENQSTIESKIEMAEEKVVAEVPKPRPVYIMPEPEPEPGIIELIFENIVYIGAGALVIILAILALVIRRRKKDEDPKPAKKLVNKEDKKKNNKLFGKKVKEEKEVAPILAVATAAVIVEETNPVSTVENTADENILESLDFDLNFSDSTHVVNDTVSKQTEEVLTAPANVALTAETKAEEYGALDFTATKEEPADNSPEPSIENQDIAEYGALDFTLSSDALSIDNPETTNVTDDISEYGALDFSLSSSDSDVSSTDQIIPVEDISEYGALDFTFSTDESALENNTATIVGQSGGIAEVVIEQSNSAEIKEDIFGENNPLFSSPNYSGDIVFEEAIDGSSDAPSYISLPDLLGDAESILEKDVVDANKPQDFGGLLEDKDTSFDDFIKSSNDSISEKNNKIDLSFIADVQEDEAGLSFLDSLDFSDAVALDDPIDSSVKDNVAKSAESLEAIHAINTAGLDTSEVDIPSIIETDLVENLEPTWETTIVTEPHEDIDALDFPVVDMSSLDELPSEEAVALDQYPVEEITLGDELLTPDVEISDILFEEEVADVEEEPQIVTPIIESSIVHEDVAIDEKMNDVDFESEQVKLELAAAYMDFDKTLARPLLDEVVRDGNPNQIAKAQELLASIN